MHALCQALGHAMLRTTSLFEPTDAMQIFEIGSRVVLELFDKESLIVDESGALRMLAATLMAMRIFSRMSDPDIASIVFGHFGVGWYYIADSVARRQQLLRDGRGGDFIIPYADQIDVTVKQLVRGELLCGHSKPSDVERTARVFDRAFYAHRAIQILVGLASLDLPALVAHEILEASILINTLTMHYKWRVITAVKHF